MADTVDQLAEMYRNLVNLGRVLVPMASENLELSIAGPAKVTA